MLSRNPSQPPPVRGGAGGGGWWEQRGGAVGAAMGDGVGPVGARRGHIGHHAVQGAIADQVADIGRHPRRTGFDELVVVELVEVFLHGRDLFSDDGEQLAQRVALLRIADAVDGGQQFVEAVGGGHGAIPGMVSDCEERRAG